MKCTPIIVFLSLWVLVACKSTTEQSALHHLMFEAIQTYQSQQELDATLEPTSYPITFCTNKDQQQILSKAGWQVSAIDEIESCSALVNNYLVIQDIDLTKPMGISFQMHLNETIIFEDIYLHR